jgi:hypothetical protein
MKLGGFLHAQFVHVVVQLCVGADHPKVVNRERGEQLRGVARTRWSVVLVMGGNP